MMEETTMPIQNVLEGPFLPQRVTQGLNAILLLSDFFVCLVLCLASHLSPTDNLALPLLCSNLLIELARRISATYSTIRYLIPQSSHASLTPSSHISFSAKSQISAC